MTSLTPKKEPGRPSLYTEALGDRIAELVAEDRTYRQIAEMDGMPDKSTLLRWLAKHDDFATKCARARDIQADVIDDRHGEVISRAESGELPPDVARVVLSGLQWRASKKAPKKYGDKLLHAGPDGDTPATFTLAIDRRDKEL